MAKNLAGIIYKDASASSYDVKCFSLQRWCQILLSLAIISNALVYSYGAKYFSFQSLCQAFQSPGAVSHTPIGSHRLNCSNFFFCMTLPMIFKPYYQIQYKTIPLVSNASFSCYGFMCLYLWLQFEMLQSLAII